MIITAGTSFDSITFSNGDFTLSGNGVTLNPAGGVAIDNVAGQNTINLPITLGSACTTVVRGRHTATWTECTGGGARQRRRGRHPGRQTGVRLYGDCA